ncbi:MAG: hypothetical protein AAF478_05470 [Pseudomonadota bacterium]
MNKDNQNVEAHHSNMQFTRALRALASKSVGNAQIMNTAKSVAAQAEEICAPAACRKSGTIAL